MWRFLTKLIQRKLWRPICRILAACWREITCFNNEIADPFKAAPVVVAGVVVSLLGLLFYSSPEEVFGQVLRPFGGLVIVVAGITTAWVIILQISLLVGRVWQVAHSFFAHQTRDIGKMWDEARVETQAANKPSQSDEHLLLPADGLPTDQLLRPAGANPETDPALLLRPTQGSSRE